MKSARTGWARWLAFSMVSFAGTTACFAQLFAGPVQIVLDAPELNVPPTREIGLGSYDGQGFAPNMVRYRVLERNDQGEYVDVTATSTWEIVSDPTMAMVVEPGVVMILVPCSPVAIDVSVPNQLSRRIRIRCLGEYTPNSQPPENTPYLDNADLETGAEDALLMLRDRGFPSRALRGARNVSDQRDESDVNDWLRGNLFGGEDWLPDGVDGLTTIPSDSQAHNDGQSRWTTFRSWTPLITLRPDHAKNLVDGVFRDANGRLNTAVRTLIHELVHVIIEKNRIRFNKEPDRDRNGDGEIAPDERGRTAIDVEEEIVHNIEVIFDIMDQIRENLAQVPRTPHLDEELRKLLKQLQIRMRELRRISPDNEDGTDPIDELFRELEWQDENKNDVPDFIERWFEQFGIPLDQFLNPPDNAPVPSDEDK